MVGMSPPCRFPGASRVGVAMTPAGWFWLGYFVTIGCMAYALGWVLLPLLAGLVWGLL